MASLTTRQRDLLTRLLGAHAPLGAADLAADMHLTPRQVTYDLKGIRRWLAQRDIELKVTPGVGVELDCAAEQQRRLSTELASETRFQLVLTAEQRQQLIALQLLVTAEPMILYQLQQLLQMSRTTILKDLDAVELWLQTRQVVLERRPNYGLWLACTEQQRRQAIAALLWGDSQFGQPITYLSHEKGLVFTLAGDANLLPIVLKAQQTLKRWELQRMLALVAFAEAQLGGRFTDDAVLHLALMFAIQTQRVADGHQAEIDPDTLNWLKRLPTWAIADEIARRLGWRAVVSWPESEVAGIAMHILATPRNERWPGDLEIDATFSELVERLVSCIVDEYGLPNLAQDTTLRDGLVIHIIPACFRQRFGLWMPTSTAIPQLADSYALEHSLARQLMTIVQTDAAVTLSQEDVNSIVLLLRAAFIRERPNRQQKVVVVCPSGMATAQLLVARLKARFPRLGTLEVRSVRELSKTPADLIVTTAPLPEGLSLKAKVIQVHPLLLPEDVETITQWLA